MEMCWSSFFCGTFLLLAIISYFLVTKQRRSPHSAPNLPPGSMGWPYIGETLQLYSQDPNIFFINRKKRYGEIFKSQLFGCPCIILSSPEAARFVLVSHAHLFKPTYPPNKERMIGPSALFFHNGDYHTLLRRLVWSSLAPKSIRVLLPDVESAAISILESWDSRILSTFQLLKQFAFEVAVITIFGGWLDDGYRLDLKKNYMILDQGYNSLPINITGSLYNKALQARRNLQKIIGEIMKERRREVMVEKDLLGRLLNYKDDNGQQLTDDQVADNIIGVMFAAQDTTASVLTWVMKYLHEDPKLFQAVKAEQMAIREENEFESQPLTWAQTRRMSLSHRVILETLRKASIISFTYREAVCDVEYNGYLIPKGWKVMPLFWIIHHNSEFFKDPQNFDAYRFNIAPKPDTFIPFGNGAHACPGNELAKMEMLVFIHHVVTKYRFHVVKPDNGVEYRPFLIPKQGLTARLQRDYI